MELGLNAAEVPRHHQDERPDHGGIVSLLMASLGAACLSKLGGRLHGSWLCFRVSAPWSELALRPEREAIRHALMERHRKSA